MVYNAEKDYYICQNNKKLLFKYLSYSTTSIGYKQELSNLNAKIVLIVNINQNVQNRKATES